MSAILWKDQVRPVAGVFWMFVYVCLGVVPLAQLSTGASTILAVQVDDSTLYAATAITLLGCVSFDLAYHLRLFKNLGGPGARAQAAEQAETLRIFATAAILGGLDRRGSGRRNSSLFFRRAGRRRARPWTR